MSRSPTTEHMPARTRVANGLAGVTVALVVCAFGALQVSRPAFFALVAVALATLVLAWYVDRDRDAPHEGWRDGELAEVTAGLQQDQARRVECWSCRADRSRSGSTLCASCLDRPLPMFADLDQAAADADQWIATAAAGITTERKHPEYDFAASEVTAALRALRRGDDPPPTLTTRIDDALYAEMRSRQVRGLHAELEARHG